jgi:hypothetical protein
MHGDEKAKEHLVENSEGNRLFAGGRRRLGDNIKI